MLLALKEMALSLAMVSVILSAKLDRNVPSNKTAIGRFPLSNIFSFKRLLTIDNAIRAGTLCVREYFDDCNNIVFLTPSAFTVSIVPANSKRIKPKFFTIG